MKKYFSLAIGILLAIIVNHTQILAQTPTLYGMTIYGGHTNSGSIFQTDTTGADFKSDCSFYEQAFLPLDYLIQATNGLFYGVTQSGGGDVGGILFSYNSATNIKSNVFYFGNDTSGNWPSASPIQASNGLLYGVTEFGGNYNQGVIYSYSILTNTETNLFDFGGANNGIDADGPLLEAANGILYGMAEEGGTNGTGIIYSYNITTGAEMVLHNFGIGTDGYYPYGSFIQAKNGLLYGITMNGGTQNRGTIFSYNILTGTETKLWDFGVGSDGSSPIGSLFQASDTLLYGSTTAGGINNEGILFSYNITTGAETDLHDFGSGADGSLPYSSLIQINDSLLYGTTTKGGTDSVGIIFSYNILRDAYTNFYSFNTSSDSDGNYPNPLVEANNGLIYGTTTLGGSYGAGTIFSFNNLTNVETSLFSFGGGDNSIWPYGSLIQANNNLLYGLASTGGLYGTGVLFSFNTSTDTITTRYNFSDSNNDGGEPYGSLVRANNGLLYGVTSQGGPTYGGSIFSFNTSDNSLTNLYFFKDGVNPGSPTGKLLQANDGLLYGMTSYGGAYNNGSMFSYNISTGNLADLHDFGNSTDGWGNYDASLIQASDSLLYGLTQNGGVDSDGIIFSYNITTGIETDVHDFSGSDGFAPLGSLIEASNGLLYGLTHNGGLYNFGTIFSYDISNHQLTVVHNFKKFDDGWGPQGSLIQVNNGSLYGMTDEGGTFGYGTIFSFNIYTGAEAVIHNFSVIDGSSPVTALLMVYSTTGINQLSASTNQLSLYPNPTTGLVTISSTKNISSITVTNLLGQILFTTAFSLSPLLGGEGPGVRQLDLTNYPAGMYFITITSGNETATQKIILDR